MSDGTNPDVGVTDVESAVASLTAPEEASEIEETEQQETEEVEASDDADEADAEAEDPDGDEPEDADDEESEPDEPLHTVKVDGVEYEVNQTELIAGYQMGKDYHQKTAALAEEKRSLHAEKQQTEHLRAQLQAELANYARAEDQPPDWVKLSKELDPWDFQQKQAEWHGQQVAKNEAQRKADYLQQQAHARLFAENAEKLFEAFPEWKGNNDKFSEDKGVLLKTARELGYSEQEFTGNLDWRNIRMLKYAMAGLAAEKAKGKPLDPAKKVPKRVVKVLKPGVAQTAASKKAKSKDALHKNLRKNGSVDSAVEWLTGG